MSSNTLPKSTLSDHQTSASGGQDEVSCRTRPGLRCVPLQLASLLPTRERVRYRELWTRIAFAQAACPSFLQQEQEGGCRKVLRCSTFVVTSFHSPFGHYHVPAADGTLDPTRAVGLLAFSRSKKTVKLSPPSHVCDAIGVPCYLPPSKGKKHGVVDPNISHWTCLVVDGKLVPPPKQVHAVCYARSHWHTGMPS